MSNDKEQEWSLPENFFSALEDIVETVKASSNPDASLLQSVSEVETLAKNAVVETLAKNAVVEAPVEKGVEEKN